MFTRLQPFTPALPCSAAPLSGSPLHTLHKNSESAPFVFNSLRTLLQLGGRGGLGRPVLLFQFRDAFLDLLYLLFFHTLPNSFASTQFSTLFFSVSSELLRKNTRGGVSPSFFHFPNSPLPSLTPGPPPFLPSVGKKTTLPPPPPPPSPSM